MGVRGWGGGGGGGGWAWVEGVGGGGIGGYPKTRRGHEKPKASPFCPVFVSIHRFNKRMRCPHGISFETLKTTFPVCAQGRSECEMCSSSCRECRPTARDSC